MATYVITQGIQGPEGAQGPGVDLFALDGITDGQAIMWDSELEKFVPNNNVGGDVVDGGTPSGDFGDEIDGGGV